MIPLFEKYAGNNTLKIITGQGVYWFSYTTCIAFKSIGGPLVVHQNIWSNTTGRHLNVLDGGNHDARVNADEFNRLLNLYEL